MEPNTGRVRAWLLVKAQDPEAAQRALAPLTRRRNGVIPNDHDVVVRVDIVDCDFNLILPVDVTDDQALRMVVGLVFKADSVKTVTVARVRSHAPSPAVEADCFIAEDETGGAYDKGPGRYPQSPGANPWG